MKHFLVYILFRVLFSPVSLLPYRAIFFLGNSLGSIAYILLSERRKYAMSNLALANGLDLTNSEIKKITRKSLQNLAITFLEYFKLEREKDLSKITHYENPDVIDQLIKNGKGCVISASHQTNWEVHFLESSSRWRGSMIGKPNTNRFIYNLILKIRKKYSGVIIPPKNAIQEGIKLINKGYFIVVFNDRARPERDHFSHFFGRKAWVSPLSATLAYKANAPLVFISSERRGNKYHFSASEPIYPNKNVPWKLEVKRMNDLIVSKLEKSIIKCPEQWLLWQHGRWRQQDHKKIKKAYCLDALAIFLPSDEKLVRQVSIFRKFYPTEFIAVFVPKDLESRCTIDAEIHTYTDPKECFKNDLRFKLIFNFTDIPKLEKHYEKLSALKTVSLHTYENLETLLKP